MDQVDQLVERLIDSKSLESITEATLAGTDLLAAMQQVLFIQAKNIDILINGINQPSNLWILINKKYGLNVDISTPINYGQWDTTNRFDPEGTMEISMVCNPKDPIFGGGNLRVSFFNELRKPYYTVSLNTVSINALKSISK